MNLIEGWGTGIPRLFREMKEYGLAEPEFIDMEIALRINLYRADNAVQRNADGVPESAGGCRTYVNQLPDQQMRIYQEIVNNGEITSAKVGALLGVKQRRARVILKTMTENGVIMKIGAAQCTKYVLNKN